ncbi:MAG: TatD family hydrolase, partial [Thermoflexus sp.]
ETDAPYLPPQPHRGRRNEPAYLGHVVEALARILDAPVEQVAAQTTENARRLFQLPNMAASSIR